VWPARLVSEAAGLLSKLLQIMRIITSLFWILISVLLVLLCNLAVDTRVLNGGIKRTAAAIRAVRKEQDVLFRYQSEKPFSLEKLYLQLFNRAKEISFYHRVGCEVKILGAKDLVNIREFFKESQYKGISCVDVLCRVELKKQQDVYLLNAFYKMLKSMPVDVLEARLEKNTLNLTLRLYGI
jgi:hypothetical protein